MKTRKDKKKKEMEQKKNVLQLHVQLVLKKKEQNIPKFMLDKLKK